MAAKENTILINKWYGGISRDEKSKKDGSGQNFEEVDIFTNKDFIQAEQIFTADSMPASTQIYAYDSDTSDTIYGYGKETSGGKVRIVSMSNGGTQAPTTFGTFFTSADATNLAYLPSPIKFFRTTEATTDYLYYLTNASGTIKVARLTLAGVESSVGTLDGLSGSFDRCFIKEIFGSLVIGNGKYVSTVDKDGVFEQHAFTMPSGWVCVDIVPAGDIVCILAQNTNRLANITKGYWWDFSAVAQFLDSFDVPTGGPQWIYNHKETIKFMCALNGSAKFFQLSSPDIGGIPIEIPGTQLDNVANATSTVPISSPKSVSTKDRILYFGLYKTDKTGVYAIGQQDSDKPIALVLSKRFATTDYSLHKPTALYIQGPNFYAAYDDNGTPTNMRCMSTNSPNRSTTGIYETLILDDGAPLQFKNLNHVWVAAKPLPASTSVQVSLASDYGSYASITRPDGSNFTGTNQVLGTFDANVAKKKSFQVKLTLVSSGSSSPKVVAIGVEVDTSAKPPHQAT